MAYSTPDQIRVLSSSVFRLFVFDGRQDEPVNAGSAPSRPPWSGSPLTRPPAAAGTAQPVAAAAAAVAGAATAAARLCFRLSDKAAGRAGGAASTARAGHGGALCLHQVPPALPLRGAVSGPAAVQGARAGAAAGNWDTEGAARSPLFCWDVLRGPSGRAWQARLAEDPHPPLWGLALHVGESRTPSRPWQSACPDA